MYYLNQLFFEFKFESFSKSKTDMQQLHESVHMNDIEFEENDRKVKLNPPSADYKLQQDEFDDDRSQNKKILIQNGQEYYKSIKENFKTSLITKNNDKDRLTEIVDDKIDECNDEKSQVIIGSVKEMAQILVNSIMTVAIDEVKETSDHEETSEDSKKNANDKLKGFRYLINSGKSKSKSPTPTSQTPLINMTEKDQVDNSLNDFNFNKSNSRLGYYKDYQTEADIDSKEAKIEEIYGQDNAEIRNKFVIEFQDEPPE